ncbi:MAG TPA: hypothetical protein VFO55_13740 [Gemmatimonadaceae bacterium]|nr:hypothetical protein [Gemmatimonadaceae bacterium]
MRSACLAVLVTAVSVWSVGCASGEKESAATDTGSAATPGAPAATVGEEAGSVHLEVTGGQHAGTYDAKMTSAGCSYGLAGAGSWGNQYSVDATDPKAFSSLQLIVPDTKAAASGTSAFKITAGFGPLFGTGSTSYDIDTRPDANRKGGSGQVTVEDRGTSGRVTFEGKTADGIGLKGTIDCKTVIRVG